MRFRMLIVNLAMAVVILSSSQTVFAKSNQPLGARAPSNDPSQTTLFVPTVYGQGSMTAIYQSGQTFISWPEDQNAQGEQYKIYRSNQPIYANQIKNLTPIATVGKGSANFYSDRYNQVVNNQMVWQPRYVGRLITVDNGPQFPANWGLLVWTLSTADFPNGASSGIGFYAVTETLPGGSENYYYNGAVGPIAEAVAAPKPVEITGSQNVTIGTGGHVYIQYMDLRNWNGTFHAPNPTNNYFGLNSGDPNFRNNLQYAYDYDVFTPTTSMCGGSIPSQLPVFIGLHGHKSNSKGGEGNYPHAYCAYGIYPYDDTDTWYFGFAKNTDYRQTQTVASGDVIVNYTEQRILRMIYDLEQNPPGPRVDTRRIYIAGQSMGGTGALAFAERYPNVFAAAYASQPITNFRTAGIDVNGFDWTADAALKFGSPTLGLPVQIAAPNGWADHLQSYNGANVWDWENLQAGATRPYNLGNNQALLGIAHSLTDKIVWPDTQALPMFANLNSSNSPWAGLVNGTALNDGHQWQYFNGLPTSASKHKFSNDNNLPFWDLNVLQNETIPGFANLSGNSQGPVTPSDTSSKNQYYNQTVLWSASWNAFDGAPVDTSGYWKMSFCTMSVYNYNCGTSATLHVDITVRRPQQFVITPGKTYTWQNQRINDGKYIASGQATADANGVLTIKNFEVDGNSGGTITYKGNRLIITAN